MRLQAFEVEQWMNDHEKQAVCNLTDTSVSALYFKELLQLEPDILDETLLDYGDITGDPRLRQTILSFYENQDPHTLTMAQGCLQANEMVMLTILEQGDHVITVSPGYQQFSDYPKSLGCSVDEVYLNPEDWSLDTQDIARAIKPETKLLILNNPSNPTGAWLEKEQLEEIVNLCRENDIWILCDEVYKTPVIHSISDLYEKGVATASLSKMYSLPGLRLGWIKACPELIEKIDLRRDYSIISTGPLIDSLGYAALKHSDELLSRAEKIIEENKAVICQWLEGQDEFDCVLPDHGPVSFLHYKSNVPSKTLARDLLRDTGIFFVPGACFGMENYLRLGLGQKHENLAEWLAKLSEYMKKYQS